MPEIWKNKQNANLKLYLCLPEGATCVCIIIFYINFVKLLRVLLFYVCIRVPTF